MFKNFIPTYHKEIVTQYSQNWLSDRTLFVLNQVEICTNRPIFIKYLYIDFIFIQEPLFKKTIYVLTKFILVPTLHVTIFFPQMKCGFWSHTYLPLVTMSLFLLFFFFEVFPYENFSKFHCFPWHGLSFLDRDTVLLTPILLTYAAPQLWNLLASKWAESAEFNNLSTLPWNKYFP